MNDTARNLHDENEHLRAENAVLLDKLQSARIENLRLKHVLARFQHHLFGKRSEKIDPNQLTLILQVEAADEAAMRVALPKYAHEAPDSRLAGRRPVSRNLYCRTQCTHLGTVTTAASGRPVRAPSLAHGSHDKPAVSRTHGRYTSYGTTSGPPRIKPISMYFISGTLPPSRKLAAPAWS